MEELSKIIDKKKVEEALANIYEEMIAKDLTNEGSIYIFAVLGKVIIKAGNDKPGLRDLMKELIDSL